MDDSLISRRFYIDFFMNIKIRFRKKQHQFYVKLFLLYPIMSTENMKSLFYCYDTEIFQDLYTSCIYVCIEYKVTSSLS